MRLPRPQFTVQWLMIAIAVVGIVLAIANHPSPATVMLGLLLSAVGGIMAMLLAWIYIRYVVGRH